MRWNRNRWLGLLLAAAPFAYGWQDEPRAPSPADAFDSFINALPTCALDCFTSLLQTTPCAATDVACLCADRNYEDEATACVRASCKLSQGLQIKNLTERACSRPVRDKSAGYASMSITTGVITVVVTIARLVFKQFFSLSGFLGPDDYIIFVAVCVGIAGIVINQIGLVNHGLGKDVWTQAPSELPTFGIYYYIMLIIYLTDLALIKLSMSLFYVHVFPGAQIRRLLVGTVVFNLISGTLFVLVGVFQCRPLNYFWTQYHDNPPHGECIDLPKFAWANAAINLAVDLWMIALPIFQIRKLDLHWKKKIGVTIMFLIGAFITVISLLRLKSVIFFGNLINPTWDQFNVAWWSTMEINIGIICTCLPTMRLMLVRMFPKLLNSDEGPSGDAPSHELATGITGRGSTAKPPPSERVSSGSSRG